MLKKEKLNYSCPPRIQKSLLVRKIFLKVCAEKLIFFINFSEELYFWAETKWCIFVPKLKHVY